MTGSQRGVPRREALATASAALLFPHALRAETAMVPPMGRARGRVVVRGHTVNWTAEAGETIMSYAHRQPRATIFSVAYLGQPKRGEKRPVTFAWNGGPGGASWHLRESLSPRITVSTNGKPGYSFIDNADSPIDVSDLVFIDAPGTGFSRVLDPAARQEYWGVEEDGRAFADFIVQWMADHDRRDSPLFLLAESYGGTRAGQVARNLAERNLPLHGIAFVSPTLAPLGGRENWYTSYSPALTLPAMAATAHYYGKGAYAHLSTDALEAKALAFARGDLFEALTSKALLSSTDRLSIRKRVADFVGISPDAVSAGELLLTPEHFVELLLPGRILNIDDGRVSQPSPPPGEKLSVLTPDEGYDRTESIVALIRELGFITQATYARDPRLISAMWKQNTRLPARTNEILAQLMQRNKDLKVLLVGGSYDLIVPYAAAFDTLKRALPENRLTHRLYQTGHGVYEDIALRPQTTADLCDFYLTTLA